MTFALHRLAGRRHRRVALAAVMLCLGTAVAVAHGGLAGDHMGDGAAMCLALTSVGALVLLALAAPPPAPRSRQSGPHLSGGGEPGVRRSPCLPPARADPPLLQVFLR